MRAFFGDTPLVQYHDVVGIAYRAQPVRHDHHRTSLIELMQMRHDLFFVVCVQGIRRLVQEDILRILIHRTGYQDALPLSLAHPVALHADFRVIAQRQGFDEVADIRYRDGMEQPFLVDAFRTHGDIPGDCI